MARLRGTNVQNHTVRAHQAEDGYVMVGSDGQTVTSTLLLDSVFSSFVRTGTGKWTATLKEPYVANLRWFRAEPQIHDGDSVTYLQFQLFNDNVGTSNTTLSTGSNPQVIKFMFHKAGTATDLPAFGGFKYEVGLSVTQTYQVNSY